MWGRFPTFFCSLLIPRRGVNQTLEVVVTTELGAAGFDLVEIRTAGSKGQPLFEIRIERRDGQSVTVDDCAKVSRALEARLDESGLMPERYVLEVSSPGDRPLRTPDEWKRFVGRWVSVLAPEHGGRFEARLVSVDGEAGMESATLEEGNKGSKKTRIVPLAAVKQARLAFRI
jgi:ribosome maturation factor RimP